MDIPELGGSWQEESPQPGGTLNLPPGPVNGGYPPATDGGSLVEQQKILMDLVDATVTAYKASPDAEVDRHLEKIYDGILTMAATVGVSAFSLPKLCAACGRKKREPGGSPADENVGLGDVIKTFLTWLGFRSCEGCERRRRWLNRIRFRR
jgi:hypothetical protein